MAVLGSRERFVYLFDRFRVDPVERTVSCDGQPVSIMPKALATLLVLLERPGEIVAKEELLQRLWPGTVVTEASLSQSVFWLRKSLAAHAGTRRLVVTVPGQGFTLAADVQVVPVSVPAAAAGEAEAAGTEPPARDRPVSPAEAARAPVRRTAGALRPGLVVLGLVLALAAGAGLWLRAARRFTPSDAPAPRPVVAVLGFRNLSARPDANWLATALSEMLTTELAAAPRLRVVPGEVVARSRGPLEPAGAATIGPDALARLQATMGADRLIVGSYVVVGTAPQQRVRVDLRVVTAPQGEIAASLSEEGAETELFAIVSRTGARLRAALGAGELSAEQARATHASRPANPVAARLYAEGLTALRRFDARAARDLLEQAAAEDPRSAPIRSALSSALAALGYDAKSAEQAAEALRLAAPLGREERLLIEGRHWESQKKWDKAAENYRGLFSFYPDDLEYGLLLAASLRRGGHGRDALEVVATLRRLAPPAGQDARIDIEEALAAATVSDYARQVRAARAAAEKAGKNDARLLLGNALLIEAAAVRLGGERQEALVLLDRSRAIAEDAGDRAAAAEAMSQAGLVARELGDLPRARALYERALVTFRAVGYERATATTLNNLGVLAMFEGDLVAARRHVAEAREIYTSLGDQYGVAGATSSMSALLALTGDHDAARREAETLLDIGKRTGNRANEGSALRTLGMIATDRGELDAARESLERALAIARDLGDRNREAALLGMRAAVNFRAGRGGADARRDADKALADKRALGDRVGAATQMGLMVPLLVESADLATAESLAEELLRAARRERLRLVLAAALQGRAELRLEQARPDDAARDLDEAAALAAELGLAAARDETDVLRARAALARGRAREAAALARRAGDDASLRGLATVETLAHAELAAALASAGEAAEARREIERVRAGASRLGDRLARTRALALAARAAGPGPDALPLAAEIRTLAAEAAAAGFVRAALEARCALALLDGADRATRDALHAEAHARGLERLARECE